MKALPVAALIASTLASSQGGEIRFYLGTYTKKTASEGIYSGTLNSETGEIGPITLGAKANNPSFLAVDPTGKRLYAAMEGDGGAVGAFAIQSDGQLQLLNEVSSKGQGACHVSVNATGSHVLVANYSSGNIASLPVQSDGSLGPATAEVTFSGSGPNAKRQKEPHAHAIASDSSGRFVYACDLGTDKVWSFRHDGDSLTPTDPDAGTVPAGGGPRHLAFHPTGKFVYTNNEMGLSVTTFARDPDTGRLTTLETVPNRTDGASDLPGVTSAEIVCHPSGKWLYVSSRGDDIIAVYTIAENGRLTLIENAPAGVKGPRGMDLDPTGRWLVVAGQKDHRLTVLKVDPETGKLSPAGEPVETPAPVSVVFVQPDAATAD